MSDDRYSKELDTAICEFCDSVFSVVKSDSNPKTRPSALYHFTDVNGMVSILSSKKLWASLATTMNDRSEFIYGIELARDVLDQYVDEKKPFCKKVVKYLEEINSPIDLWIDADAFIVSFCTQVDKATHWQHYGRSGAGIALEFDPWHIQAAPFNLFNVLYDRKQQIALVETIVKKAFHNKLKLILMVPQNKREVFDDRAAHLTATVIRLITPQFKNPAFDAESEWRLITYHIKGSKLRPDIGTQMETKYRVYSNRVIPYVELHYENLPLKRIILGQNGEMLPEDRGLSFLVQDTLGRIVPILRSDVPVR